MYMSVRTVWVLFMPQSRAVGGAKLTTPIDFPLVRPLLAPCSLLLSTLSSLCFFH